MIFSEVSAKAQQSPLIQATCRPAGDPLALNRGTPASPVAHAEHRLEASDERPMRSWTGVRVVSVGPPYPRPPAPEPPGGLRHRAAALLEIGARWPFDLAEVELHGLAAVFGTTRTRQASGLEAWAFVHLDAPLDSLLLASLWRRLPSPDALPPRAPLALSRRPDTWPDRLAVRGVLAGLIAEVVVDDQVTGKESRTERATRSSNNADSIAWLRSTAENQRRPLVVFPEGAISDDGLIRVSRAGFLHAVPPRATLIVSGVAYESFGGEHNEAVVCSQAVEPLALHDARACADAVQRALLRATPITLTSLIGYYLLEHLGSRNERLDLTGLCQWTLACLRRLGVLRDLCVHRPLQIEDELATRLQRSAVQMSQLGYVGLDGRLTARLGPIIDLSSADQQPQRNRQGPAPHRRDPLGFWGNRLRQQAACWPALRLLLAESADPIHSSAQGAFRSRVSDCPVM